MLLLTFRLNKAQTQPRGSTPQYHSWPYRQEEQRDLPLFVSNAVFEVQDYLA